MARCQPTEVIVAIGRRGVDVRAIQRQDGAGQRWFAGIPMAIAVQIIVDVSVDGPRSTTRRDRRRRRGSRTSGMRRRRRAGNGRRSSDCWRVGHRGRMRAGRGAGRRRRRRQRYRRGGCRRPRIDSHMQWQPHLEQILHRRVQLDVAQVAIGGPERRARSVGRGRQSIDREANRIAGHRAFISRRGRIIPIDRHDAVLPGQRRREDAAQDVIRIVRPDNRAHRHRQPSQVGINAIEVHPLVGRSDRRARRGCHRRGPGRQRDARRCYRRGGRHRR